MSKEEFERKVYEGKIEKLLSKRIYLNIGHLESGMYELNIIHNKRTIKIITFRKS